MAPCTVCHSSLHRGMRSLGASLHGYKRWQYFRSSPHSTGRTLSAFADFCHNRRSPETGNQPREAGESHTLVQIEITCQEVLWLLRAIPLGLQERAQAGHMPGDPSSSVQGQPLFLKLEVVGFALGNMTLIVEVVYPIRTYDHWWVRFVGRPP